MSEGFMQTVASTDSVSNGTRRASVYDDSDEEYPEKATDGDVSESSVHEHTQTIVEEGRKEEADGNTQTPNLDEGDNTANNNNSSGEDDDSTEYNQVNDEDDYLGYKNQKDADEGGGESGEESRNVVYVEEDAYRSIEESKLGKGDGESQSPQRDEETQAEQGDEQEESANTENVRFARVPIVRETTKKPFLGGYKNKQTGKEYHNASTQTYRPPTQWKLQRLAMVKYHRETQTVDVKFQSTQPKRESSTQMTKPGVYIAEASDTVLIPRTYFTAEQLHELKLRKAVKIQCMVRSFIARRRVRGLREAKEGKKQTLIQQQEAKRQELADLRAQEIERRRNPRTKEDFNILYKELEAWRKQETARIESQNLSADDRKAAMFELLQKQTKLLQTIDKLKQSAGLANKQEKVESALDKMAQAKVLQCGEATTIVETPFTKRAQELRDLYNGLKMPLLTIDQRLDVLLHVKWTVKEFDCRLTKDLIELIDREADLLNRGRSEQSVEGLRQRILSLFLQFIETPEFNPEAAKLKYIPSSRTTVK